MNANTRKKRKIPCSLCFSCLEERKIIPLYLDSQQSYCRLEATHRSQVMYVPSSSVDITYLKVLFSPCLHSLWKYSEAYFHFTVRHMEDVHQLLLGFLTLIDQILWSRQSPYQGKQWPREVNYLPLPCPPSPHTCGRAMSVRYFERVANSHM